MVDIHTHILHRFDDGPETLEESVALIKDLCSTGVTDIVSTSHIYCADFSAEDFTHIRNKRLDELKTELERHGINVKIHSGAEVQIDPIILNQSSISALCFEGTNRILLEIPHGAKNYEEAESLIYKIASYYNVKPIIAHVERYKFFTKKLKNLEHMKSRGYTIQVDSECFTDGFFSRRFGLKALKAGLVDVIASDCHNLENRRNDICKAYEIIENKLGKEYVEKLKKNAEKLISR